MRQHWSTASQQHGAKMNSKIRKELLHQQGGRRQKLAKACCRPWGQTNAFFLCHGPRGFGEFMHTSKTKRAGRKQRSRCARSRFVLWTKQRKLLGDSVILSHINEAPRNGAAGAIRSRRVVTPEGRQEDAAHSGGRHLQVAHGNHVKFLLLAHYKH